MFTGIIEGLGTISGIRSVGESKQFNIDADFRLDGTAPGDSIAVNGACLTATMVAGHRFQADVSSETLSKTTFGWCRIGDRVNLERALRFSDRLDGHLVSGHIDGIGTIVEKETVGHSIRMAVDVTECLTRYIIRKGSVAVDGVSLTVNASTVEGFEVAIIPHTARWTTLRQKKPGDTVNIETDMIGKYVERFLDNKGERRKPEGASIDMAFLAKSGYL